MKRMQTSEQVIRPRTVERLVAGKATSDGAGVKLTRVLTQGLQHRLDPFLVLLGQCLHQVLDHVVHVQRHQHALE